jgi:hypothetical protein
MVSWLDYSIERFVPEDFDTFFAVYVVHDLASIETVHDMTLDLC